MGIQINGSTDRITAIDGTIDFVSNIGNIGLITASNYVLQDAITIGAGSTIIKTVNGKLGIGTDNAASDLHINSAVPTIRFTDSDTSQYSDILQSGHSLYISGDRGSSGSGGIIFRTQGTNERLRIKSNGFVGIGTDNPTRFLHVQDDSNTLLALASTDSNADLVQSDTGGSTRIRSVSGALEFFAGGDASSTNATSSVKRLLITSDGDMGLGASNPGADPAIGNDATVFEIRQTTTGNITSGNNRKGAVLRLKHEAQWENGYQSSSPNDDLGRVEFVTGDNSTGEGVRSVIRCRNLNYFNSQALTFEVATSNSTSLEERVRIDSSGRLIVGAVSSNNVGAFGGAALQVEGLNAATSAFSIIRHSADTVGSSILMGKTRGTSDGATTVVQDDDVCARIIAYGADGTDTESSLGSIQFDVDGTPGSNDMPGRIVFSTTPDGAATYTERLRITSGGDVCINQSGVIDNAKLSIKCDATQPAIGVQANHTNTDTKLISAWNSGGKNIVNITAESDNSPYVKFEILSGNSPVERFRVTHLGNVAIGGGTAGSNRLEIIGDHKGFVADSAQPNATLLIKHGTGGTDRRWIGIGASTTGAWIQSSSPGGSGLAAPLWINKGGGEITLGNDKLRIESSGDVAINTLDGDFGQSNGASNFAKGDPKLGVHGSIAIMNTSATTTDFSQLAFYRRTTAETQGNGSHRITSTSNLGKISWNGASNDTSFPDEVCVIQAVANGGDWWSGSNRRASLQFHNNNVGEMARFDSSGVFSGRAIMNRTTSGVSGGGWTTHGAWKVLVDLNIYPSNALYMCDAAMQDLSAYTATFWVYKSDNAHYCIVYEETSLCSFRLNGTQIEIRQNSGADQTTTSGYQKIFCALGMNTPKNT